LIAISEAQKCGGREKIMQIVALLQIKNIQGPELGLKSLNIVLEV